jgi:hypothetical protein
VQVGTVSDELIDRLLDSIGTWRPRQDRQSAHETMSASAGYY